jgi:hypothetical protein
MEENLPQTTSLHAKSDNGAHVRRESKKCSWKPAKVSETIVECNGKIGFSTKIPPAGKVVSEIFSQPVKSVSAKKKLRKTSD